MRLHALWYTSLGLVVGTALTLSTVASAAPSSSVAQDPLLVAQKAQVIATTYQLDRAGLHEIEEALISGAVPAGALGTVRKARAAATATDWPEPLRQSANQVAEKLAALEAALRAEDAVKAAPLARDAHEAEHDFSTTAYGWLMGSPASAPAHGH